MMNRSVIGITSLAIVAGLSACGGGGNDDAQISLNRTEVIDLTGSERPPTTVEEEALERAENINLEASPINVPMVYVESTDGDVITDGSTLAPDCTGLSCTIMDPETEEEVTYDFTDVEDVANLVDDYQAQARKYDIDLFEGAGGDFGPNSRLYGAWLDSSSFTVITQATQVVNGATITARTGFAGGELTDTQLAGDATWVGVMVGTPATGPRRDELLQGDVELTYTASEQHIDADFTEIVNLDRNAAHRLEAFSFADVDVDLAENTYKQANDDGSINGGFYGANHVETVGTFEWKAGNGIVGAFGALKDEE